MKKQKTLFRDKESKWKPRNKQAALIARPAKPEEQAREEDKPPTFAKTEAQIIQEERDELRKSIEAKEPWLNAKNCAALRRIEDEKLKVALQHQRKLSRFREKQNAATARLVAKIAKKLA